MVQTTTTANQLIVHETTDYGLFKELEGNRVVNKLHLRRLKDSMAKNYLFTIITVNELMQIIDGQHRFNVCRELQLPIYYVKMNGYGLREVQILNANNKVWNSDDYLSGYCDLAKQHEGSYEDYLIYKDFKDRYQFGHSECLLILTQHFDRRSIQSFFNGDLKIDNYANGVLIAKKLEEIGKFYSGYKRKSFVRVIVNLLKNPNFVFSEFIHKVQLQPMALKDCTDVKMYRELIEEVYNYRRKEKINLRFDNIK